MIKFASAFAILCFFVGCTTGSNLFKSSNLHEQYGKKLENAGLKQSTLAKAWFAAAETALLRPVTVTIPYMEAGYFASDAALATGLQFNAKRGQKLSFSIGKQASVPFALFVDIWKTNSTGNPVFITSLDTAKTAFDIDVRDDATYVLRLQPELLVSCSYTVTISVGPSLKFPVAGSKAHIGSFWGADRDGGSRRHEGIDIFAPKLTPVIAASAGRVSRVNENNLGGKVVWLQAAGKDYTLYYAHLDQQLVSDGQQVKEGDTLGLVGNTGNARTTSPHLHFGIYTTGGAIDPLPFVNTNIEKPVVVQSDTQLFKKPMRLKQGVDFKGVSFAKTYKANTLVIPFSHSSKYYKVLLPDGIHLNIPKAAAEGLTVMRSIKLKVSDYLLDVPSATAAYKRKLAIDESISLLAQYDNYWFVETTNKERGWIDNKLIP